MAAYRGLVGMMIVSLWHAPIPWVHAHDLSGPGVAHSAALHHHIDEFHARDIARGEEHLALHSHLMLPWKGSNHDEAPGRHSGGHAPDDVLFTLKFAGGMSQSASKPVGSPSDRAFDAVGLLALPALQQLPVGVAAPLAPFRLGGHFFDTFGRPVSIADLFGVRLC